MAAELWTATRHPSGKLTIDVNPHPGQARAIRSTKRFVFMLAGTQGGKTSFGPLWLLNEILHKGPGDYIGVTSTHPLLQLNQLIQRRMNAHPASCSCGMSSKSICRTAALFQYWTWPVAQGCGQCAWHQRDIMRS